ncbi:HNH endonuclease [Rossellomorea marisflavi]|uniref:HNH endonuclease n=1 Tax=Rossellomorea marisflavi TaxID=189381 RepID=UPI0027A1BB5A|nr:HNH endonuclease signature motif containing protein [Rossellomorea marisflavi]UTE72092.1 HNH endonuclease [Rossellomorea marisflavi]
MITPMDLSEILLYLDLLKSARRTPDRNELNMMLYYLGNYVEVKMFYNKLKENDFNPPFGFFNGAFIHFIEEYDDLVLLKNKILQTQRNRRRRFTTLFTHQILLSKSQVQALNIVKEAREYGIKLEESWADKFDSIWLIKNNQLAWKENIIQLGHHNHFQEIYQDFHKLKQSYFESIPLNLLRKTILKKESNTVIEKIVQNKVNDRSVYIKEFARRNANGICQLCGKEAPFKDRYGNPFLEVHHIEYLSKGGTDTIDNVVALCPNCHRKIHILEFEEDKKIITKKAFLNIK